MEDTTAVLGNPHVDEEQHIVDTPATAGDRLRALSAEAAARGTQMVSAQAMQARLFEVYDDASASPDALQLVQHQLSLTLERTWFSPAEIAALAERVDAYLEAADPLAADPLAVAPQA